MTMNEQVALKEAMGSSESMPMMANPHCQFDY